MEKELRRLDKPAYYPLSVAICDIDGLRMINSAFGHEEGDRLITVTAKLIQSCLKQDCTFARMGGGEFMILLPSMSSEATHRLKIDIKHTIESFNLANHDSLYAVNLSIGHSTKETEDQRMEDVLNRAEAYLQRRKLLNQNSTHSAIVSSVMATLYAKSQETETHGLRLGQLCQRIGEDLGLDPKSMDDLQLLSKLHDIGKIGTDDRILNKPARLTPDEWEEMKQHPRIGYDIAMTIPHLEHIAEYILHHHERWDGQGYPVGLHREDIPLLSRVLAVADAYDAMTERRIYRDAIPKHLAIEEIRRCSGTQFDPDVVDAFLRIAEIWDEGDDPENEPGRFNF
jgi:diguanylate cyclase (GGDEF)-like protein